MNLTHFHNRSMKRLSARGFTLVELMVSLAVFSIVMTISVGTLLVMVDLNAKAQALYSATTNLSFALDSMSREIRTGYHYNCAASNGAPEQQPPNENLTNDCSRSELPSNRNLIAFIREENGEQMAYRLNADAWGPGKGSIEQNDGSGWMAITARDVVVQAFELIVANSDTLEASGDEVQPVINLKVRGYVENGLDTETDFFIQTRITQRRLDIL